MWVRFPPQAPLRLKVALLRVIIYKVHLFRSIIELRQQAIALKLEVSDLKKSEFKKMLKKENHPIMKGRIYEVIFVAIYMLLCATLVISFNKDLIPSNIGIILVGILLIIGIPYVIIDFCRDSKIKKMYEYHNKENKILEVKDNSNIIKIILIVEMVCSLILGGFVMIKYVFNEESKMIEIEPNTTMLKDGTIIQTGKYKFDHDNFSLIIPLDFVALDEDMIKQKYPNGNPPKYVLSNDRTTINLVVSATEDQIKNSEIKNFLRGMESQLSKYSDIIDTSFFERDGHEIGEIKFISKAVDTDIYNHMIVFSDNGYLKIVSFNCTKELQENWQSAGETIIHSLTFK